MKKRVLTLLLLVSTMALKTWAQPGAAMNFDGIDDRVKFSGSTVGAFTLEFWMRTTQTGPTGTQWYQGNGIVDSYVSGTNNDFGVSLLGTKVAFGTGNPDKTLISTSNVNTGNWVHIAAMFTSNPSGEMWLYVDGVLEGHTTSGVSNNSRNTNSSICMGSINTNTNYFNGDLDEVRFWNYVMSNCVLQTRMNCELVLPQSGLLRYFQFNQGIASGNNVSITSLTNALGTNHGNITAMAMTGNTSNFITPGAIASGFSCNALAVNVKGNGNNIADGATTTSTLNATNYGSVCANALPITTIFTIENNSTYPLSLGTVSITGANAASFSVTAAPPTSLAVGSNSTFAVTFTPTTIGTKSATVSFTTSDCGYPTYDFRIGATVIGTPTVTVNSGSICSGNSFTISPSGAVSYSIEGGSSVVSPTVTTTYTVVGTSAQGCYNSIPVTCTVNVTQTPTISVNSGAICSGQSFTLAPSGAATYTYVGGGPVVSPTITSSYSVTGSNGSCISSNTAVANVTVNPTPTITASVSNPTICAGSSTTLSATGASSYTWNPGNITSGTTVVTPTVSTTYSVVGSNGLCSQTKTVSVQVNSLPNVSISGSSSVCLGNSITLTGTGAITYTWDIGPTTNTISVSPTVTTSYTVTGTNANGCVNSAQKTITVNSIPTVAASGGTICAGQSFTITPSGANTYNYIGGGPIVSPTTTSSYSITGTSAQGCASSNTAVISVVVNPSPTLTLTATSTSICSGASVTLNVSGANTYTWSTASNNNSITVSPTITTNYSVTGTGPNGCQTSSTKNITVNSLPVVSVSNGTICAGDPFTISPSGASTYTYLNGGPNVNPTVTTSYSITGTSSQGCPSSNTAICNVTVKPLPPVSVTSSSNTICMGNYAILTASGANSYYWSNSATTYSIFVAPFFTTTYTVTGTGSNGCSQSVIFTQNVINCTPTGVEQISQEVNGLKIYPNPVTEKIIIETFTTASIEFMDLLGKTIYRQTLTEGINEISLADFNSGIYFAVYHYENKVATIKIIKN